MLNFKKINKNGQFAHELYILLSNRGLHSISHQQMPCYEEHLNFVLNNPYRCWYAIFNSDQLIGTCYLLRNNCLGIYIDSPSKEDIQFTIKWLTAKYKPLRAIKSVRPDFFFINLSNQNEEYQHIFKKIGLSPFQISYKIN